MMYAGEPSHSESTVPSQYWARSLHKDLSLDRDGTQLVTVLGTTEDVLLISRSDRSGLHASLATIVVLALAACGGKDPAGPGPSATLDFQVTGLPLGATARVTVSGPNGFLRQVTGSGRLSGLDAGTYVSSVRYVIAQNQTWNPQVAADTIALQAGDTVQVQVGYTAGPLPAINYGIAGYQMLQSVQRTDNSVPMVAQRAAYMRVFGIASAPNTRQAMIRVRLFLAGAQIDSFDLNAAAGVVPTTVDTASLSGSWNVLIPAARVVSGLSFSAELDPDDAIPETNKADNRFPPSGMTPVAVQSVPQLDMRFVPVTQSINGLTGAVNSLNKDNYFDLTRRMFPLGSTTVDVRAPFTTAAPVLQSNDGNGAWSTILGEVNALRGAEGANWHYLGVVQVTYGSGIAGLGYIGWPAAVAWDRLPSAAEVFTHELGHNFGRNHAPCGGPSGVDALYPYANAGIGVWGMDLGPMQLRSPLTYVDVMSYCNPDWISDYNYLAILSRRGPGAAVAGVRAAAAPGLLIWGRIVQGSVVLEPAFEVNAPALLPAQAGTHRVEGFDSSGTRMFGISFEGDLVADLPRGEERHFAFVVPLTRSELARLGSIRLVGQGLTAGRSANAALRTGGPVSRSVSTRPAGTATGVRWNPSYPLAVIRDSASGQILGFGRGGEGTVAAAGRALRVDLSDGVTSVPGAVVAVP